MFQVVGHSPEKGFVTVSRRGSGIPMTQETIPEATVSYDLPTLIMLVRI